MTLEKTNKAPVKNKTTKSKGSVRTVSTTIRRPNTTKKVVKKVVKKTTPVNMNVNKVTPKPINTEVKREYISSLSTNQGVMVQISRYDLFWMLKNAPIGSNLCIIRPEKYYEGCAIDSIRHYVKMSINYYHEKVEKKYGLNLIETVNDFMSFENLTNYGIVLTTKDLDTLYAYDPMTFAIDLITPFDAERNMIAKDYISYAINNILTAINTSAGTNYVFEYQPIANTDRTLYVVIENETIISSSEDIYSVLVDMANKANTLLDMS